MPIRLGTGVAYSLDTHKHTPLTQVSHLCPCSISLCLRLRSTVASANAKKAKKTKMSNGMLDSIMQTTEDGSGLSAPVGGNYGKQQRGGRTRKAPYVRNSNNANAGANTSQPPAESGEQKDEARCCIS